MVKENEDTIFRDLRLKKSCFRKKDKEYKRSFIPYLGVGLVAIVVIPIVVSRVDYAYTGFISLYIIVPLAILPFMRMQIKNLEDELRTTDFELDLQKFEVSKEEIRAEKFLLINNYQLRRYYDLNLSQNIWVFGLGIFCILLGIAVIVLTLYLLMKVPMALESKIITGVVGSIGAIMTNYIAAIYLKMHAAATGNLGAFHARLVETNQLLFGNFLASRIRDEKVRWQTLSQLALKLSDQIGFPVK